MLLCIPVRIAPFCFDSLTFQADHIRAKVNGCLAAFVLCHVLKIATLLGFFYLLTQ